MLFSNKDMITFLDVSADELNKVHREHEGSKVDRYNLGKITKRNTDNGYYRRQEWAFSADYVKEILIPIFHTRAKGPIPKEFEPGKIGSTAVITESSINGYSKELTEAYRSTGDMVFVYLHGENKGQAVIAGTGEVITLDENMKQI